MKIEDRSYTFEEVVIDGNSYLRCSFTNCRLVYSGGEIPMFNDCEFRDSTVAFADQAKLTLLTMNMMYRSGFDDVIEFYLNEVRTLGVVAPS